MYALSLPRRLGVGLLLVALALAPSALQAPRSNADCGSPPGSTPNQGGPPCPTLPDLVVLNFSVQRIGPETVQISLQVKNQGGTFAEQHQGRLSFEENGKTVYPLNMLMPALGPGQTASLAVPISSQASRTLKVATFVIDDGQNIKESNENNNTASATFY